jgi:GxxExxY protein
MNADHTDLDALSETVLGAVFEVSNTLGAGFLEKVYQRALLRELNLRGMRATAEASFAVTYKSHKVGEYFADLLIEDELVVELKCAERLAHEHTAQCLNYLRASGRTVCLLVNFQRPKVEWKRVVRGFPPYWTTIRAVLLTDPPTVTTTDCSPTATPVGTRKLICVTPTSPLGIPTNSIVAA